MNRAKGRLAVFLSLLALAGCEKSEKKAETHEGGDAGEKHVSGADKDILEAVAAAASPGAPGTPGAGPPPSGVFPPGAADHEIRPGEPPKLALGGKGSGPTIQFAPAIPKKKLEGQVEVSVQTGPRSAMPTIDLLVSFDPPAKPAADAPPGPLTMTGRVTASKLAKDQPGDLPPGLDAQIAKARGSRFELALSPTGGARFTTVEVAKDFDTELGQVVKSATDSLSAVLGPYPSEPVGEGAFWMVTSRETFAGLDVVVYRMTRLEKIDGTNAIISVSSKRYVAGGRLGFAGLPPHQLAEFSGTTQGKLAVPVAAPYAASGEFQDVIMAGLDAQQNGQQGRLSVHLEIRSRVALVEH
ncbi:MAG TPA: hypothetical protein VHE30_13955 [Polyangiaceae bacterium]|nr:hypothetical protein [Polyangiaceae bacterium]